MASTVYCGTREAAGSLLEVREYQFPVLINGHPDGSTWISDCYLVGMELRSPRLVSKAQEGVQDLMAVSTTILPLPGPSPPCVLPSFHPVPPPPNLPPHSQKPQCLLKAILLAVPPTSHLGTEVLCQLALAWTVMMWFQCQHRSALWHFCNTWYEHTTSAGVFRVRPKNYITVWNIYSPVESRPVPAKPEDMVTLAIPNKKTLEDISKGEIHAQCSKPACRADRRKEGWLPYGNPQGLAFLSDIWVGCVYVHQSQLQQTFNTGWEISVYFGLTAQLRSEWRGVLKGQALQNS